MRWKGKQEVLKEKDLANHPRKNAKYPGRRNHPERRNHPRRRNHQGRNHPRRTHPRGNHPRRKDHQKNVKRAENKSIHF